MITIDNNVLLNAENLEDLMYIIKYANDNSIIIYIENTSTKENIFKVIFYGVKLPAEYYFVRHKQKKEKREKETLQ